MPDCCVVDVSIGAPAAVFVQRHRAQIFPNAPMVFIAMEQRRISPSVLTEQDTVVVAFTWTNDLSLEEILKGV